MAKTPLQHAGHHHVISTKESFLVLMALAGLMALTIGASYWDAAVVFGRYGLIANNVIAMAIATIKALLVMTFFMGLKYSSKLARLWAAAGFVTFSLMFIILFDYNTRSVEYVPSWDGKLQPGMKNVVDPNLANKPIDTDAAGFRPRDPRE